MAQAAIRGIYKITSQETGEVFDSGKAAAIGIGQSAASAGGTIANAAKHGTSAYGLRWEYVERSDG